MIGKKIEPIRGLADFVLPTVYGEAISYQEQLAEVTSKCNEIVDVINCGITDEIKQMIIENFNDFFAQVNYTEDDRTLHLGIKTIIIGDGDKHVYNGYDQSISIVEREV